MSPVLLNGLSSSKYCDSGMFDTQSWAGSWLSNFLNNRKYKWLQFHNWNATLDPGFVRFLLFLTYVYCEYADLAFVSPSHWHLHLHLPVTTIIHQTSPDGVFRNTIWNNRIQEGQKLTKAWWKKNAQMSGVKKTTIFYLMFEFIIFYSRLVCVQTL